MFNVARISCTSLRCFYCMQIIGIRQEKGLFMSHVHECLGSEQLALELRL